MTIHDAYNHKNKTSIAIQDIFDLKYLGQFLFPLPAYLKVKWDLINQLNIYKAYSYSNTLYKLYVLEYDHTPFILITYNLTSTQLKCYCTNKMYYEEMMKHFVLFSNYYICDTINTVDEELPNL